MLPATPDDRKEMIGARLGSYEILGKLGEGGMGVVYRAKDFQLGREVALKVLPEDLQADPERLARFEREARVLAQLNHPNIAQIYGLETAGETRALVMELVAGPTLAERLEAGPFPLAESFSVALQIALALEEAHEKGIVHRDLKPQNIKASIEGRVKVLDFGLAKAMDPLGSASGGRVAGASLQQSPTLTAAHGTQMGVILGTAAYMSPEQAKGFTVDKRADIWAFGVVLYEMLTGARLFAGDSVTETLAEVLKSDVDFAALPPEAPPAIRRLLRRCLERNPKNRLHDIADARIVIEEVLAGRADAPAVPAPAVAAPATSRRPRALLAVAASATWRRPRALLAVAGLAAAAALGALLGRVVVPSAGPSSEASTRASFSSFRQLTREPGGERWPSLSPDGQSLAYVKSVGGQWDVFLQRVDGRKAINLTADCAEDDLDPEFSPDGRSIAYSSGCGGGGVFVMGATGESSRRVSEIGVSPSWSPDGRELAVAEFRTEMPWAVSSTAPLWVIRVDTGERRPLSERGAIGPAWSPDGRRIAFWGLKTNTYQRDLWTVAADGSEAGPEQAVPLTDDAPMDWGPAWSPEGDAVYFASSRSGATNLWRIGIDPATGAPRGRPEPVNMPSGWAAWPSPARDGRRLAFVDRNARTTVMRVPFDPAAGRLAGPVAPAFQGSFELFDQAISPDGGWILFSNAGLPANLHLVRADGTGYRQLLEGEYRDRQAHWSPDGRTIAFQSSRWPGGLGLVGVDGGGMREIPLGDDEVIWEPRWSPDGSKLAMNGNETFLIVDLTATPPRVEVGPAVGTDRLFSPGGWMPDGSAILGSVLERGNWSRHAVYSVRDRSVRELPDIVVPGEPRRPGSLGDFYPQLLPDGRRFLFVDRNRLLLADVAGGPAREVHRAPIEHQLQRPSLSADGRWLTFLDVGDESDIWLAERSAEGEPER